MQNIIEIAALTIVSDNIFRDDALIESNPRNVATVDIAMITFNIASHIPQRTKTHFCGTTFFWQCRHLQ